MNFFKVLKTKSFRYVENLWYGLIEISKGFVGFLRGIDIFINAVLGGDGRETISSRLGKYREICLRVRFIARFVDWLFFFDKNHTKNSTNEKVGHDSKDDNSVWK